MHNDDDDVDGSATLSRRALLQSTVAALAAANASESLITDAVAGASGSSDASSGTKVSVAEYIVQRLSQHGCKALFGVPGATCDPFYEAFAEHSELKIVVTTSDLEAGYAADGYARMRGLGAVAVTYGVGTLSLLTAIAGAYVERSPVVVINGGPSKLDLDTLKRDGTLFSHSIGRVPLDGAGADDTLSLLNDLTIFKRVTAFAKRISTATEASKTIDDAIGTALRRQRPVYIEVAKDVWDELIDAPSSTALPHEPTAGGKETQLAGTVLQRLSAATNPALLIGIEVQRYGLASDVKALVEKLKLPWATTLLSKSVLPETTPGFVGVYEGDRSPPIVKRTIGGADALLTLGCVFGRQYRGLVKDLGPKLMAANDGKIKIATATSTAQLKPLVAAMTANASWRPRASLIAASRLPPGLTFEERRGAVRSAGIRATAEDPSLTYDQLMGAVSQFLDTSFVVLTDTSLSMYPAAELNIPGQNGFVANAVWQAIGYSPAAAIGVGIAELPSAVSDTVAKKRRPLVICGDGGFQMTAQALSTFKRAGLRSIVIVIDNGLYAVEQFVVESIRGITPGDDRSFFNNTAVPSVPYLAVEQWDYVGLAKSMGLLFARKVTTVAELKIALNEAKNVSGPALISASIWRRDIPSELRPA